MLTSASDGTDHVFTPTCSSALDTRCRACSLAAAARNSSSDLCADQTQLFLYTVCTTCPVPMTLCITHVSMASDDIDRLPAASQVCDKLTKQSFHALHSLWSDTSADDLVTDQCACNRWLTLQTSAETAITSVTVHAGLTPVASTIHMVPRTGSVQDSSSSHDAGSNMVGVCVYVACMHSSPSICNL